MVDDWGWANVGYHQQAPTDEVVTPNMNDMAKEGVELDQHYAFGVCAPSRSIAFSLNDYLFMSAIEYITKGITILRIQYLGLQVYLEK